MYDNNRDLTTAQDSCASWSERAAAGERILGRGFQLAASLVPIGIGAKSLLGKAALADGVLVEAGDEGALQNTRVFYSGGRQAQLAAEDWANANGAITLELPADTPYGQVKAASKAFAQGAAGEVNVFQSASGVRLQSIWATTEYPALVENPNVTGIRFHVVMPDGSVAILP